MIRASPSLVSPTYQSTHQSDCCIPLKAIGGTNLHFSRDSLSYLFERLIGIPFMESNDISVWPYQHQMLNGYNTIYTSESSLPKHIGQCSCAPYCSLHNHLARGLPWSRCTEIRTWSLWSTCCGTTPPWILWCAFDITQCEKQDPHWKHRLQPGQPTQAWTLISVKFVQFMFPLQSLKPGLHILAQRTLQEPMPSHMCHTHYKSQLIQMTFLPCSGYAKISLLEMTYSI